ncbi:MAG: biotin/lipoyl-binding protein [Anaerolineales bacterium]|nr:biotin/lipoyl-binding protein [Anaerolineales bacterium]
MKIIFNAHAVEINKSTDGYLAEVGERRYRIEVLSVDKTSGRMDLKISAVGAPALEALVQSAYVSADGAKRWVTINGQTSLLTKTSGAKQRSRQENAGGLTAPMPGQVRGVAVSVGEAVKKGQTLLTLEAMKMEIRIQAAHDGKVKSIHVAPGQTVEREQNLIELEV